MMRRYDCRPDTKAGNCGDDTIAVCVSLVTTLPSSHSRLTQRRSAATMATKRISQTLSQMATTNLTCEQRTLLGHRKSRLFFAYWRP